MKRTILIVVASLVVLGVVSAYLWTLGLTPIRVTSPLIRDTKLQVQQSRHTPLARIFDFSWSTTWEISKSTADGNSVLYSTDRANTSDRAEIGVLPNGRYFLRITDANNRVLTNITFVP